MRSATTEAHPTPWFPGAPSARREETRVMGPSGAGAWKEGRSQDPSRELGEAIPRPRVEKEARLLGLRPGGAR